MRLKSIELKLFKPLMHSGTRHVKADDLPSVMVISGENGSGKSSLLRECTPYPACRTDYEKDGYKKVVYEHGGSVYELTSDFSKSQGAHSFVKDGVELNESGTTEVQEDLVETYFDYNDVVEKLVSGKYKICDMGKPERKTLIMSTYPSSLAFVLEYHKAIASKLRAAGNNIKMLSQRELALKGQLISPTILSDYKKERDDLNKATAVIDMDIYSIDNGIKEANKSLASIPLDILQQSPDGFINKMKSIESRMKGLMKSGIDLPKAEEVKIIIERLNNRKAALESKIQEDNNSAYSIRTEMDQYEKYLNTDVNANIKECKNMIEVQDTIIKNTVVEEGVPIITSSEVEQLKNNASQVQEILLNLKKSTTPFWDEHQYRSVEIQLTGLKQSISQVNSNLARLDENIGLLEVKKAKYTKNGWPKDCVRVCPLRDSFADLIKNIDQQLDLYKKDRDTQGKDRGKLTSTFDDLKKSIEVRSADREVLLELDKYFSAVTWGSWALGGKNLVESLNSDITKIYNNITKLLENAEKALKVKEAKELKVALEAKLTKLENNSAPAEQLIKDTLVKREIQLNELVARIKESREKIAQIEKQAFHNDVYANIVTEIERVESDYNVWKKVYILQEEIRKLREFISDLMDSRFKIQNKLRELDTIIKEQDSYLIRLNDEVLVNLEKYNKEYNELAIVESQLSPTKGIPHLYTVKYVNSIFKIANEFIRRVWSYDMSLAYLAEGDESFDYSFKLLLHDSSEIKDINMASAGQKAIINLSVMLAICIFRQYCTEYPIILDEVTVNLSIQHQNSLVLFLNELLSQNGQIMQVLLVDHCVDVCSSFASIAQMICLSKDMDLGEEWTRIGTIE